MGRRKLSVQERTILLDIIKRAVDLPFSLAEYSRDIGLLREELGIPSHVRGEKPKGFVQSRNVHARPRYGAC